MRLRLNLLMGFYLQEIYFHLYFCWGLQPFSSILFSKLNDDLGVGSILKCQKCGKEITEQNSLVHTDISTKEKTIICQACFKTHMGIDYKTFQYRKESAKQGCFAVLFCLCATIYAFIEKGPIYGLCGLIATALIYFFAMKIK